MLFNSSLIGEFRQKESMSCADLAKRLGIGKSHIWMLERGEREPGFDLVCRLIKVTGIPLEKWDSDSLPKNEDTSMPARDDANAIASLKNRLNREHQARVKAEERLSELDKQVWKLEQANERLAAEIRLRVHFEDIVCAKSLSQSAKSKKLRQLAAWAMEIGEFSFDEIRRVLRKERHELRSWLDSERKKYECRFVDGGVLASSPGEAALCLRCSECSVFDSGECVGYGSETPPENIIVLLDRLEKYGVYDGARQAKILKKYYNPNLALSPQEISNIRYRARKGLPIRDDVFFLDVRKRK